MTWGDALQLVLSIAGATAGAYAAVRAELAALRARMLNVEAATARAHERIDVLLQRR